MNEVIPEARRSLRSLGCQIRGHRWVESKPHHMWGINTFDCLRCGATKDAGFDGRGL